MSPRYSFVSQLFVVATFLFACTTARGQITNVTADQTPPIPGVGHDYIKLLNEAVNPATGSVSIQIGIPVPPGRGITVPFAFTYDSNAAHHLLFPAWVDNISYLGRGGWSYLLPRLVNQNHQIIWQQSPQQPPYTCTFNNSFVFNDLQGRSHSLGMAIFQVPTPPPGGCTYPNNSPSSISSGGDVYVQSTATTSGSLGYPIYTFPVTVADEDGTVYYFSGSHQHAPPGGSGIENLPDWIETRNGNKITYADSVSNNGIFSITDSLGRTLLSSSGFGTSGNTLTIAGPSNPYTLTWGTATYNTSYAFTISNASGLNYSCIQPTQNSATSPVITAIALPNGKSYQFQYDPASGLLSKVIYPTGGYVRYVWGANQSSDVREFLPDTNNNFTCAMVYDTPAVQSRYVSFDGSTEVQRQDFTYSTTWLPDNQCTSSNCEKWTVKTTTVVTHDLLLNTSFETDYSYAPTDVAFSPYSAPFVVNNGALQWGSIQSEYFPVEQTVTYKSTTGSVLETVTKGWIDQYRLGCELQTLDNNLISGAFYSYGPGSVVTDKKEYDFGQITSASACQTGVVAPSGPYRETVVTPQTFAVTPIFPTRASIFDLPASVIIKNNSGTVIAETDYSYDQATVASATTPAGTHDETNYGPALTAPRGNATTVTKKCLQSCANSVSTLTYYETGQIQSKVDACGNITCSDVSGTNHTTLYSYNDNFDSNPPTNTNAYVTQTTNPLGQITKFKYAFADGQLIASTDLNNVTTSYVYADSFRRLTETDYPDGGKVTISYSDTAPSPSVTTSRLVATSPSTVNITTTSVMDGMGHVVQTQLTTDPDGATYTDTTYDGIGRVRTQSNPHRSTSASTDGITTNFYDALGRPCLVVPPDGTLPTGNNCPTSQPINTILTTYSGNTTTVTDQAGKSRRTVSDGLGRLTTVFEDPSGLNYETDYTYDLLDNLMTVNQKGGSTNSANWRTRTFTYNSLSGLTQAANPESGAVSYSYDANGNLSTQTSPKPNQTGTATVMATYSYDVLNRLTQKSFNDGSTPTVKYGYDGVALTGCTTAPPTLTDSNPIGSRTAMCDGAGAESWSHDSMGRVLSDPRTTSGTTNTLAYQYNLDGSLHILTYPSGNTMTYTVGGAGRQTSVVDGAGTTWVQNVHYAPHGPVLSALNADTMLVTNVYNNRLWPCQIAAVKSTPVTSCTSTPAENFLLLALRYSYEPNGNVSSVQSAKCSYCSDQRSYTYDSLNRLATAATSSNASNHADWCWAETYTYDAWGNLLSNAPNPTTQSAYIGCVQEAPANLTGVVQPNNRLNGMGFTTDSAGNLIADGVHIFTYDAENHLLSTAQSGQTTVNYIYDGDGRRVSKSYGTYYTLYWYGDSSGDPTMIYDYTPNASRNGAFEYVPFAGKKWAYKIATAGTYGYGPHFYYYDNIGNMRISAYGSGGTWDSNDFYSFGGSIAKAYTPSAYDRFQFSGKERDSESNLDNFGARYYLSSLGRFMTPDWSVAPKSVPYADFRNPQSLNLYSYVKNNPVTWTDPDGHCTVDGETHGWVWCAAHWAGFTQTKTEEAQWEARMAQQRAEWEAFRRRQIAAGHMDPNMEYVANSMYAGALAGFGPLIEPEPTRGGIAPVLKGQAGVNMAIEEVEAEGGQVLGTEITIENSAGRARADFVYKNAQGNLVVGDAKNGPTARVNGNQTAVYAEFEKSGGSFVGSNAREAGLPSSAGPTQVRIFKYNGAQ